MAMAVAAGRYFHAYFGAGACAADSECGQLPDDKPADEFSDPDGYGDGQWRGDDQQYGLDAGEWSGDGGDRFGIWFVDGRIGISGRDLCL